MHKENVITCISKAHITVMLMLCSLGVEHILTEGLRDHKVYFDILFLLCFIFLFFFFCTKYKRNASDSKDPKKDS